MKKEEEKNVVVNETTLKQFFEQISQIETSLLTILNAISCTKQYCVNIQTGINANK